MISGGPVVLIVRNARDEAADRALAGVITQLEGMRSGPDPDEPSTGPGNVLDVVRCGVASSMALHLSPGGHRHRAGIAGAVVAFILVVARPG
jgi:hypothetical protein